MSKRPVAFRVPRLLGDMVSHYFLTDSEDEARAMADTNQVEYEGLYLVGDRRGFGNAAQARQVPAEEIAKLGVAEVADAWAVLESHGFPPEAVGWPQENIGGKLPGAIDSAITALVNTREDLLAEVIKLRPQCSAATEHPVSQSLLRTQEIMCAETMKAKIAALAHRFWSIHPSTIAAMNLTREEFYAREMTKLLATEVERIRSLNEPQTAPNPIALSLLQEIDDLDHHGRYGRLAREALAALGRP